LCSSLESFVSAAGVHVECRRCNTKYPDGEETFRETDSHSATQDISPPQAFVTTLSL
jgi:hypothetical protein